ncbi:hypothetical protein LCGC14_1201230 [marine sediment metagenome]|uniref:Uncharacterized protein n=1 Tax=marine sediment metagenome TaxID=412755 RepID=A0A0F9LGR9_9ZZZZ
MGTDTRTRDDLLLENRDYKACVRYMVELFTQQAYWHHKHLRGKDHNRKLHRIAFHECPAMPCKSDREDLAEVQRVIDNYHIKGDPIGNPEGAV